MLNRFASALGDTHVGRMLAAGPLDAFQNEQSKKLLREQGWGAAKNYMSGMNFNGSSWSAIDPGRGRARKTAAGLAGGLLAASALGVNPLGLASAASSLTALGANVTAGHTLYNMGGGFRAAGVGYLGLTAFNTFRGGNQPGPM
jgi:hypothetical protein